MCMEKKSQTNVILVAYGDYATAGRNTPHQYWVEFRTREYPPQVLVVGEEEITFSTTTKFTVGLIPPEVPPEMEQVKTAMKTQATRTEREADVEICNPKENIEAWAYLWAAYLLKKGYSFVGIKSFSDTGWALGKKLAKICGVDKVEKTPPLRFI